MKNKNNFLLFSILLVYVFMNIGNQAVAYDKKSVVERFTNASCGPCATINNAWYNATTGNLVNSGAISHIIYNVWWPGASDPMYQLNLVDNTTRTNYYGVTGVPDIYVNGTEINTSQSALTNAVNNGNSQYSPFNIVITQGGYSETLIEAIVKITRDPNDNTTFGNNVRLQFGITEKRVVYSSPPGSNGESEFFSVSRKMLPDANGTILTIPAPGEFTEITLQYVPTAAFIQAVNLDSVRFVAFIQDHNTKEIYQSEMQEALQNYVAVILPTSPDVIGDNTTPVEFSTVVRNIGLMEDTYDINVNFDSAPTGWTGEYTSDNGTFSFGQTDVVTVAPDDSTEIYVTVNPNGVNGSGETAVEFSSHNNPGFTGRTVLHNVTTTGVEILVVDASEGDYGSFVVNSLDNVYMGELGLVSRSAVNASVDLSNFHAVTWSAGNETAAFYPEEVSALEDYLEGGGNLFINGQNIGSDIFEPGGQSQFAQSFYNNYLHADYIADVGPNLLLQGYDGDPITDGIQPFVIGDIYERSADEIAPFDSDATPILKYLVNPAQVNSIRVTTSASRIVYLGIGFEQITDEAVRDTIMARSINWLSQNTVGVTEENSSIPDSYSLDQNYPNPFNPSTKITYSVSQESPVTIKVFDLIGQEVAVLVDEVKEPGYYSVTFDALGLSSGIYIYRMRAGDFTSVKKMSVLK